MAYSPNVVILGKSNDSIDNEYIKDLISSIDPNGVPNEFIHRIFVIDEFNNRYLVPEKVYAKGISYSTLHRSLDKVKTENPIKTIEIVIDLLSVKRKLDIEANELFSHINSD